MPLCRRVGSRFSEKTGHHKSPASLHQNQSITRFSFSRFRNQFHAASPGGIPTTLAHSGAQVKMPDCVGFRSDGSNANDGLTPDVFVPWAGRDTPYRKANKLLVDL